MIDKLKQIPLGILVAVWLTLWMTVCNFRAGDPLEWIQMIANGWGAGTAIILLIFFVKVRFFA